MKIVEREAKSIYTDTGMEGVDYTFNQYVGCGHGCRYCYARFVNRWKDYGRWGTWIEVKVNAPELAGRKVSGSVSMSSVSDPYQPLERERKLTRRVLQKMDRSTELSILTKSDLILRDIDLLKEFENLKVALTVNCFPEKVRKILEPEAPPNSCRIEALEELNSNGIRTFCFISPVIPRLTEVREVLEKTGDFSGYYLIEILNTKLAGKGFRTLMKNEFPKSYEYLKDKGRMENFIEKLEKYLKEREVPVRSFIEHSGDNHYS